MGTAPKGRACLRPITSLGKALLTGRYGVAAARHQRTLDERRAMVERLRVGASYKVRYRTEGRSTGGSLNPGANLLGFAWEQGRRLATGNTETIRGKLVSANDGWIEIKERLPILWGVARVWAKGDPTQLSTADVVEITPVPL